MTRDELIELWCQALESGEYVRGTNCLKRVGKEGFSYCCLGVACEVAKTIGVPLEESVSLNSVAFNGRQTNVPTIVRDLFGLRTHQGEFFDEWGVPDFLTNRNDTGTPFKEIAALIRSRPKGLFVEEP